MQVEKNASIYRHRYEATICHTHTDLKDLCRKRKLLFLIAGLCHMQVEKNASIYRHRYEATICHTHTDLKDLCRKRKLLFLIAGTSM